MVDIQGRKAQADRLIKEGEARLERLREAIERQVLLGHDPSATWKLYRITAGILQNMRVSQSLIGAAATREEKLKSISETLTELGGEAPRLVDFRPGEALDVSGGPQTECWVVEQGCASLLLNGSSDVEISMVCKGGIVGVVGMLGIERHDFRAVAAVPSRGLVYRIGPVAEHIDAFPPLRGLLEREAFAQMEAAAILVRCSAKHSVRQRVARWILTVSAMTEDEIHPLTHQRLADLLGTRRASVTMALHELEGERALVSHREKIKVRDRQRLEAFSCGCHRGLLRGTPLPQRSAPELPDRMPLREMGAAN